MADQFCLRWNNFQTNIVSALDSLKCSEDLVDVTLTCEGRNIKAHKVILSACSPYFRNVFKENPCQHPVIILKDVSADDIVSLLSYMYQGEVFIEESKLTSFLHTAALLQVKGLTGVTQQNENVFTSNAANKLYTQLTISSKPYFSVAHKEKMPALKKRRCSTSDKPNEVPLTEGHKKSKVLEPSDIYNRNNGPQSKSDNTIFVPETQTEKKNDLKTENVTANGKNGNQASPIEDIPVTVKTEWVEDSNSSPKAQSVNSDTDNNTPDYENSMLARSLISGINPSKSDNTTNSNIKKCNEMQSTRIREASTDSTHYNTTAAKSPIKNIQEDTVKVEKSSPKLEIEYEPEILLSEQQDGADSDSYTQEQSQALLLLAGMSALPVQSASTSQTVHQSNHAAICGDCPHCGMKYSNQSALKYHVRLMHSDLTNRLCCYLCPRSFTMRETFKEHMWSSHGQRN
ncbi:broad-complex core protein isoforms 1/2/3/4/5-like [Danaus plexippus]|uniref:broad-complex core protein isoforms 1/2/3/4/5-like n=1 Tax=Danaus plexippus TaxID=13037 RepID=UPI002AB20FA1|nr:broad-complex core protein isoforms 1/2/3/4/5-like [Danaus plexippus]